MKRTWLVVRLGIAAALVVITGCAAVAPAGDGQNPDGEVCRIEPPAPPAPLAKPLPSGKHYQAARAALAAGDLGKAGLEVKLALQDDPRNAAAHFLLGCLLERKGQSDRRSWRSSGQRQSTRPIPMRSITWGRC